MLETKLSLSLREFRQFLKSVKNDKKQLCLQYLFIIIKMNLISGLIFTLKYVSVTLGLKKKKEKNVFWN